MQTEIVDFKSKLMSNMAAVRDSSNIVAAMITAGVIKPKNIDDASIEINFLRNKFMEWHLEGLQNIATEPQRAIHTQPQDNTPWESLPVTEGQERALYAITKANPELLNELPNPNDLDDSIAQMSKQEASDFIDKYGKKR